jgi:DNA-binding winged helix-turn-helix (wHTH) protein/Tol biopolymer transport system component
MMAIKSFVFRFDDVEVREREFSLIKAGKVLTVEPKAFRTLLFLLHNPQRLISKEELLNSVWGDAAVTEGSLTRCIWLLRSVLGDDIRNPRYIETVATVGYRWVCKVEVSEDASGEPEATEEPTDLSGAGEKDAGRKRLWAWALAGGGLLALCLAGMIWYLHRPLPPLRVTGYSQITHDGRKKSLAGTDGSRLYFSAMPGEATPGSIAQVAITGGLIGQTPVALPSPMLVDVSPDGTNLLVMSVPKEDSVTYPLWDVRVLGGSARRLGEAVDASFSPDANSAAYSTPEGDIWVVQSDGTGAHKLASVGGAVTDVGWSPDDRVIRFSRDGELWEMSSSGLAPHRVLPGWLASSFPCCVRWILDGKFFLYLAGDKIWALDERRGLFRRPPAGPIQLTTGPMSWGRPIPSRDGSRIFAEGTIPRGELSRFDSKTKLSQPFLGGISAQGVIFSKDGKSIAYVSYPDGILWKANRDGSNPVPLIDSPMNAGLPRWSPDGTQIIFQYFSPTANKPSIYIVSSEGGSPPKLLNEISELFAFHPNWSPDGRKIIFNSIAVPFTSWVNVKFDVHILDLDSHQVTTVPGSDQILGARWSPDGRYLAAGTKDEMRLMIFDFKTQRWSEIAQKGVVDSPEWSRDGKFIYFRRPRGDIGVFRILVKGGVAEKIVDLKNWHDAGWDGKYMGLDPTDAPLLLRDISSADIYALTLEEK